MRRLKLYTWSVLAILAVILIAAEFSFSLKYFVMVKLAAMAILLIAGYHIRYYTDVMEKDIDFMESLIKEDCDESEDDENHN